MPPAGDLLRELALTGARLPVQHDNLVLTAILEVRRHLIQQRVATDERVPTPRGDVRAQRRRRRGRCGRRRFGQRRGSGWRSRGGQTRQLEAAAIGRVFGEEAGIDGPYLARGVLVAQREHLGLGAVDAHEKGPIGPLAGLVRGAGGQVERTTSDGGHVLDIALVEVAAQDQIDRALELSLNVRPLDVMQPVQWVVDQRNA